MIDSNNIDVIRTNIRTLNEKVLESNGDIATIIEDVSDLEDDVGTLKNVVYTTPTDLLDGVTLEAGGYGRMGNFVTLFMRINLSANVPNGSEVCTIPTSQVDATYYIQTLDQNGKKWRVKGNKLVTGEQISAGVAFVNICYLAN